MGLVPPRASLAMTSDFFWNTSLLLGRTHQPSGMVGVKGRSGGYRPGAGRRPGATAIKKKATSKGIKKVGTRDGPPEVSLKKLTAFFFPATPKKLSRHINEIVRATHSLKGPTVHV